MIIDPPTNMKLTQAEQVMQDVEIIQHDFPRGDFRAAIFDFDGTLSLIRRNWQDVMIPMMVEVVAETGSEETQEELYEHVEEFVMRLTGRQTIYQMIQLAAEVQQRGQKPLDPLEYKRRYHELLWRDVGQRIESIRTGSVSPDEMTVPGSRELLTELMQRGITLFLASGTDLNYVKDEVELLGLSHYFGTRIHGALDDYKQFSKARLIEQIIREADLDPRQLVGFGDGFVEIEEVKKVGGLAIGVASDENARRGINAWKRERLIRAGADIIIGDYQHRRKLLMLIGLN